MATGGDRHVAPADAGWRPPVEIGRKGVFGRDANREIGVPGFLTAAATSMAGVFSSPTLLPRLDGVRWR